MIRILIVDDHEIVRRGLAELLSRHPDFEVVGEADTAPVALEKCHALRPDLVLVDHRLPGATGVDLIGQLRDRRIQARTIILTTFSEPAVLVRALREGASGFLSKDTTLDTLAEAIESVHRGRRVIRTHFRGAIAPVKDGPAKVNRRVEAAGGLTEREREVLQMIASGLNNRDISSALNCTEGTVKNRVSSILAKLGARSRTQAVLLAQRENLL